MRHLRDVLISWGPLGIFVIAAVESAGIPNPGGTDLVLLILAAARPSQAAWCAALAVLGSLIGTQVLFEIARKGGEAFLSRHTARGRGARFRRWFHRYGLLTVFVAALVPVPVLPFKLFVVCAGALAVSRSRFVTVMAVSRIPRYFGLAYLGARLGQSGVVLIWIRAHTWQMLISAVVLFAALYWVVHRATIK